MAIDSKDNVLLANSGDYAVKKYNANGEYLLEWKTDDPVANPQTASPPSIIAVDPNDNVYVLDTHFGRIKTYSENGTFLGIWNNSLSTQNDSTPIFDPTATQTIGMTFDNHGAIYISYTGGIVRKYYSNGTFITQIGPDITNGTKAWWIPDIAVNNNSDSLYLIDSSNSRIAAFASDASDVVVPEFNTIFLPILVIFTFISIVIISRLKLGRPVFHGQ